MKDFKVGERYYYVPFFNIDYEGQDIPIIDRFYEILEIDGYNKVKIKKVNSNDESFVVSDYNLFLSFNEVFEYFKLRLKEYKAKHKKDKVFIVEGETLLKIGQTIPIIECGNVHYLDYNDVIEANLMHWDFCKISLIARPLNGSEIFYVCDNYKQIAHDNAKLFSNNEGILKEFNKYADSLKNDFSNLIEQHINNFESQLNEYNERQSN